MIITCGCIREGRNQRTNKCRCTMTEHNTTFLLHSPVKSVEGLISFFIRAFWKLSKLLLWSHKWQGKFRYSDALPVPEIFLVILISDHKDIFHYRNATTQLGLTFPCVNLSQGFPNYPPPDFIRDELTKIAESSDYSMLNPPRDYVSKM